MSPPGREIRGAPYEGVAMALTVCLWRHPRPEQATGRCIGRRTDLRVDPRRAKRLAHRVRAQARREGGPHEVWTSSLRRAADVGRWLARWGWAHRIDDRLAELDFGQWDGRSWDDIGAEQVDAWCRDFAGHPPGGGEAVAALMVRCAVWLGDRRQGGGRVYLVGHAGWINAARLLQERSVGDAPPASLQPSDWPPALAYGAALQLVFTGCAPISACSALASQ